MDLQLQPEVQQVSGLCCVCRCENTAQATRITLTSSWHHISAQTSISVLKMMCAPPLTIYTPKAGSPAALSSKALADFTLKTTLLLLYANNFKSRFLS